jgi:hypothetical protein
MSADNYDCAFFCDKLGILFSTDDNKVTVVGLDSQQYHYVPQLSASKMLLASQKDKSLLQSVKQEEKEDHAHDDYKGVISLGHMEQSAPPPNEDQPAESALAEGLEPLSLNEKECTNIAKDQEGVAQSIPTKDDVVNLVPPPNIGTWAAPSVATESQNAATAAGEAAAVAAAPEGAVSLPTEQEQKLEQQSVTATAAAAAGTDAPKRIGYSVEDQELNVRRNLSIMRSTDFILFSSCCFFHLFTIICCVVN